MPSVPATTKIDFQRYLNDNESEVPGLRRLSKYYRQHNRTRSTFGMWLHARHLHEFQRAYHSWWLHRPRLWNADYAEESTRQPTPIHQ